MGRPVSITRPICLMDYPPYPHPSNSLPPISFLYLFSFVLQEQKHTHTQLLILQIYNNNQNLSYKSCNNFKSIIFIFIIYAILKLAESQNVDCLVLSAFGCGAFRNPPNTVAKLFMEYLAHFSFKKVVFAIIDNTLIGRTTSNYKIFKSVLSGQRASSLNPA